MGTITSRISHFRGINRSAQQNGLDVSYAYNAENVDISGGKLSSKIGSYRMAVLDDVPPARPIPYFTNQVDYLILRKYFIKLADLRTLTVEQGGYEPGNWAGKDLQEVVTDWTDPYLLIRGVGRSSVRARIDNVDTVICSGMLAYFYNNGTLIEAADVYANGYDDYWYYRDFMVDGASARTCVYYLGDDSPDPKIHCRVFGSGLYLFKDVSVLSTDADEDGVLTSITIDKTYASLTDTEKNRLTLDGVYLFSEAIGANVDEDDINNAYMWLEVTSIESGANGNAQLNVKTKRQSTDVLTPSYAYLRGGCSDMTVTFMQMFYGRLFAAAHRSNRDHPRRLYWSCLPGDGRTIEDWTMSDASVDTSGGHVDIGDPYDGYITGLIVCGSQMLIFTQTRLWRLYGTAPSNYTLELVGNLEGTRVSNPVEINGTVYWLSRSGITYYNGSYIAVLDDNCSTRRLLESMPDYIQDSIYYSSVHANLFDNNIMFAIDATWHYKRGRYVNQEYDECFIIRYNLETGDVIKYVVPAENYRQQFTDVLSKNFGVVNGNNVKYETRYFQALVHKAADDDDPYYSYGHMTLTQWKSFGMQEHGWYDGLPVNSVWESDWNDLRAPEAVKKAHTVIMRGSGEFDFTIESEVNKEDISVKMPDTRARVKELSPHYAEGRSMKFTISSDKEFEIEPYMTMIYEAGSKR